jgi:hypothetical protein
MSRARIRSAIVGAVAGAALVGAPMLILGSGAAGGSSAQYKVIEKDVVVNTGQTLMVNVKCPMGYEPIGGGGHYGTNSFPGGVTSGGEYVAESDINVAHSGWETAVVNTESGRSSFTVDAVCALR